MPVDIDLDILSVAEFMQSKIPASRLVSVAAGIKALSPLLWGHFAPEEVRVVTLSLDDQRRPPSASGLAPG